VRPSSSVDITGKGLSDCSSCFACGLLLVCSDAVHCGNDLTLGLMAGLWGWWCVVLYLKGQEIFLSSVSSGPAVGHIPPPRQWLPGTGSLEAGWPGHEADHSPPSSAEVKNEWGYTSAPTCAFRRCTGITVPSPEEWPCVWLSEGWCLLDVQQGVEGSIVTGGRGTGGQQAL
jgi:hypothetical protein